MEKKQYYVQYHNADKLKHFPYTKNNSIESIVFDASVKDDMHFFTKKKMVQNAIGNDCFLIVGTGKGKKQFYLWSVINIKKVKKGKGQYDAYGKGFSFENPILLNDLLGFSDFQSFCGQFGLGFQNITNHQFSKTLVEFADNFTSSPEFSPQVDNKLILVSALGDLNERMQSVIPEKRVSEVEMTLRKDQTIVSLLKQVANYQCQFPDCASMVLTKTGQNYVEVAHVKPVNDGGQSILGNLIVLCPNHHKEFDYGDLQINEQTLSKLSGSLNGRQFAIDMIGTCQGNNQNTGY